MNTQNTDLPDLIAGALGVSRGTAYDMMREALAEQPAQQQEPAFWTRKQWGMDREFCEKPFTTDWEPLYTSPPASKPLTDEEIDALAMDEDGLPNSHIEFARAIEAAHGIKGEA